MLCVYIYTMYIYSFLHQVFIVGKFLPFVTIKHIHYELYRSHSLHYTLFIDDLLMIYDVYYFRPSFGTCFALFLYSQE